MSTIKRVATLENGVQAQLLASLLDEEHIPHHIRSYHDSAYDGLFQAERGWGHIEAPEEYEERILELIADLSEQDPSAEQPDFAADV